MGEIYDNPALYEAYPELAQKTVRMEDSKSGKDKRTRGAYGYVAEDGSIVIDSSLPADEVKTALVHEIQHSIQAIEGFSRGGNKEMAKKYISEDDMRSVRDEYRRESEQDMTSKVIESRAESGLFKKSPDIYGKVIQRQMEQNDMGTIYIDAAKAAETEPGQQALRALEQEGAVTHEQITQAVADGRQLEVKSGVYMQTVSEETDAALKNYKTFDKNGPTLDGIKTWRENVKRTRESLAQAAEMRKQKAAQHVIDETFPDDGTEETELNRSLMNEILSGGTEHIKENYARLKKEALDAWGEMIGVKPYLDYKGQGTGIISYVGEHGGWEGTRVTANEGWYSQFYKEHGRAPGERERYDIADREARAPMEASNDPEAAAELKNISAAKSRVEALEGLDTVIKGLDIPDLEARSLLSEKSYDLVYKPVLETLSNGPEKAAKAARESAIIMGRMADAFAVQYGVPVEKIAPEIMKGTNQKVTGKIYGEAFDVRRIGINKLSEFAERLKNGPKNPRLDTNGKIIHENAGDLKLTGDTGVIFPGERISHYEQHDLNGAHLDDIQQHVDSIEKAVLSKWQNGKYEGQYKGIYVIARVKGDLGKYYAVFCFTPNGKKYLTTVVKESDGGIYKKEIEDKTATVLSDYSSAETDGLASSSISTDIIQKKLAKRNNDTNEPYHQMAGEHAATAMVGRLQSAETMERNGTSPEEI